MLKYASLAGTLLWIDKMAPVEQVRGWAASHTLLVLYLSLALLDSLVGSIKLIMCSSLGGSFISVMGEVILDTV